MINTTYIEGRLTEKPQTEKTPNGKTCIRFTICHNEYYKKGEEWVQKPNFFRCTAWERTAEYTAKLEKGDPILVSGKLKHESYNTADGQKKHLTYILAMTVQKLAFEKKETPAPAPQILPEMDDFTDFKPVDYDYGDQPMPANGFDMN